MSRLKKYHNPHHYTLEESITTVKRSDLQDWFGPNETSGGNVSTDSDALERLNQCLAPLRDEFTQATRGRKRKRSVSPSPAEQKTELRLLTHRPTILSEPQLMSDWPSSAKSLPVEDCEEKAEERRCRAMVVAVDSTFIIKQSSVSYPTYKPTKPVEYRVIDNIGVDSVAVLQTETLGSGVQPNLQGNSAQPISREPKPKSTILVRARSMNIVPSKRPRTARACTFHFSHLGLGGKSAGYAWGYPGSFPRLQGSTGYIRDNLKKGLDSDAYARLMATRSSEAAKSRSVRQKF